MFKSFIGHDVLKYQVNELSYIFDIRYYITSLFFFKPGLAQFSP